MDRAHEVHAERPLPVRLGRLDEGRGGEHARVAAQQVHRVERLVRAGRELFDRLARGDIGADADGVAAELAHVVGHARGLLLLDVAEHDAHPGGVAGAGEAFADAAAAAGDHGDAALELLHRRVPPPAGYPCIPDAGGVSAERFSAHIPSLLVDDAAPTRPSGRRRQTLSWNSVARAD